VSPENDDQEAHDAPAYKGEIRPDQSYRRFDPVALWGLLASVITHGAIAAVVVQKHGCSLNDADANKGPSFIAASLVKGNSMDAPMDVQGPMGEQTPKQKKALPDKVVPQQATQKPESLNLGADAHDKASTKKTEKKLPVKDDLSSAFDRAKTLYDASQPSQTAAGSKKWGVRYGTANSGKGDVYFTRIADLWNRNWALPAIIPGGEAKKLYVLVAIRIDSKGEIQFPVKFHRRSGNSHFDASVDTAWRKIKQLPIPPPDRFASILAHGLRLKLNWNGIQ
jgi:hypothetical protein